MNKKAVNNTHSSTYIFVYISLMLTALFPLGSLAVQSNISNIGILSAEVVDKTLWKTWKEDNNIHVAYHKSKNSPLIEIKVNTTIQSSLSSFLLFIQDTKNMPLWLDNAHSSQVIENISPQENLFIVNFNSFWPVSERYMLINSRHWQNDDLSVEIQVEDVNKPAYLQNNMIKIEVIKAHWLIKPVDNGNINITYTVIADPKGIIPHWIVKRISLNSLWKTMNNMYEQLPLSNWQTHTLPYIIENNSVKGIKDKKKPSTQFE
ncbi:START domain-containing protein [Pseudocolwellia sp. HL-MZ19]|uniref:START domain-containing protein n=1 Tax=unclassified Pseudocolwellia TaxID=2848178 RepID=UPI003CF1F4B9